MDPAELSAEILAMFELKKQGVCPFCKKKPELKDFRNALSVKEYRISGICQPCQDDFFGAD